ncbi:PAS domain-containing protein [Roseivivax isoporae]|uniref:Histidine kinase n=1 Tax=Roseivivax isoporae LMG 25204 TaxID=1449351 RepID=X7F8H6_9RHOB|nr:PAS domain-containing protein [Roseivivax isoporae]ETX29212.1 histidine kinase [Roseivivax isoporae LMG 25204]
MHEDPPGALGAYIARSGVALALARGDEDSPLLVVNEAFCKLSGYDADDVIGRNCRFLQGAETRDKDRQAIRDFLDDDSVEQGRFPILNYRKDGTPFHNLVFMARLRGAEGDTRYILASQFDMTSALQRNRLPENDAELGRSLSDMEQIGREFGLAMLGSAEIISGSVAMMARMTLNDDGV